MTASGDERPAGFATVLPQWRDPSPPPKWPWLILLALVGAGVWVYLDAQRRWDRLDDFCARVEAGRQAQEVLQAAHTSGLHPSSGTLGDERSGLILVREHTLLGTFYCDVAFADGVVTSKRVGSQ